MAEVESNAAERRRWNDDAWTAAWLCREQLTSSVTEFLLGSLVPQAGWRVLDIGSGGGTAAFAVAPLVGPDGKVVGADISARLVQVARERARERGLTHVSFTVADVQHDLVPGGPFDLAISQFGVMFFDEPAVAFANIRRHLVPGGRLAFVCWQAMDRNPWFVGHSVGPLLPRPLAPPPGKAPTGPFTLGDPARIEQLLRGAGWVDVTVAPFETVARVDRSALYDESQLVFMGVPEELMDAARTAAGRQLAALDAGDGRCDAPLAFQVVTALNP